MQIRIYLDGTFEATAGKYSFATDKERRDRIKVLQGDLKIMDKVEKLRVDRETNKKAISAMRAAPKTPGNTAKKEKLRAKDKEILGKIKELKSKLTSPRHSSSKIIGGMIRQTMDTVVGGKTIGQIAKEAGIKPGSKAPATVGRKLKPTRTDPGKGIRRDAKSKEQLTNAEHTKLEDQKEHYRSGIAIHKANLAKVPKGKKYDNRRQMLRDNIRDAEDKLAALVKSGKKAAKPAAPARKPRSKPAAEKALDRVHNAENKLIEYRQTRAKIAELQKQKVQTAGHTRRAAIDKQIETLQAKLDALSPSKK